MLDFQEQALGSMDWGVTDFIYKPIVPELIMHRVDLHMRDLKNMKLIKKSNISMYDQLKDRENRLSKMQVDIIEILADIIETRDYDTSSHNMRTQYFVECMIRYMYEYHNPYQREVMLWNLEDHITSSILHDIGKIGIPDEILKKEDPLSEDEYAMIREHVAIGGRIIDCIIERTGETQYLSIAKKYIMEHHEKWNGHGYPNKLSGADISLEGRLMAIVDTYDAIVSLRPYKESVDHEQACIIVNNESGEQFDPELVKIFNEISHKFIGIK
jgi:putative two-component system response regulator